MMIRPLQKDAYTQGYQLIQEMILNEKDAGMNAEAKESILSYLKSHLDEFSYLASFEEEMTGILVYDADTFRIILLMVKEAYRHQDIASSLLDHLKEIASSRNISKISVNALNSLEHFYRSNGFEESDERNTGKDMTIVPMEYYLARNQLGKVVTVIIEAPYGSYHPTIFDARLPYNFGYVKQDLTVEDMQFQDAYVIGPEEPLDTFTGVVIGIVYHKEDEKSRWIVVPRGMMIKRDEIIQLIGLEEQYYDTKIIWSK